jgi:hypothetical protein
MSLTITDRKDSKDSKDIIRDSIGLPADAHLKLKVRYQKWVEYGLKI